MAKHLVVLPLKSELRHFLDGVRQQGLEIENNSTSKLATFYIPEKSMIVTTGGHGKVQYGIQAQHLLAHFPKIESFLCVGAGGGLAEYLRPGDIVIGEKTIEHDYTEKFNDKAELPEFLGHPELILKFNRKDLVPGGLHLGFIASGDEDIVDPERAGQLHQRTRALAVAWEGVGGARACQFNKVPFLEIRAITDNARESVAESFAKNLGPCMHSVAKLVCQNL